MKKQKCIFICPLDWGLGHATRCIPIINELLENNVKVIIGANGRPLELLKSEFPNLSFIRFPGYDIQYDKRGNMLLKIAASIPKIMNGIKKEHLLLKQLIKLQKIDAVISDNRYGLWHKDILSVFITHQLSIMSPFAKSVINKINYYYIKKYNECWVPDFEGENNLSGKLSHQCHLKTNTYFIGPLSRFEKSYRPVMGTDTGMVYSIMAIISGPEPQRSIFEKIIIDQLKQTDIKAIVIQGITEKNEKIQLTENITVCSHFQTENMLKTILSSGVIISRSGYSTIMDLAVLGKKAIFVPTQGQTEQEYLAEYHKEKGGFYSVSQKEFNLKDALQKSVGFDGAKIESNNSMLKKRIKKFVDSV